MDRIGDAFVWPFRDPDWLEKIALMGLILLIPIVGGINGLGWMLTTLDRLRAGEERLPPAGLDYIVRGFSLFVVYLAYYVCLAAVAALLYVPAVVLLAHEGSNSTPNGFLIALGIGLLLLTLSLVTLGSLVLIFAMPSIVLSVDRGGIGGGFRFGQIAGRARISLISTLIAGLMLIAAGLVGQLGSVVCLVGVVFTSAYALAMQAWIIRSFEVGTAATPAAP
jgi:hypothetical protein